MYKRLRDAIKQQLSKPENAHLNDVVQERDIPLEQISVTILPDDFEFEGARVVNGEFCNTAGEYKEALNKNNTDMGGWTGTGS